MRLAPLPSAPLASLIATALLNLAPGPLPAAPEPPSTTPAVSPTFEVELSPAIPDADVLSEWILEEGTKALAELEPSPERRGTIRVSVSGNLYDYDVSIITIRDGSTEEQTRSWPCECTNDQMLAAIRKEVQAAARDLVPLEPIHVAAPPTAAKPPPGLFHDLQLRGSVGLGLMAGGAVGTVTGIALLGVGKRERSDPTNRGDVLYKDYRVPGVPVFLVGVGLLAAGTTLFVLDRRDARRRSTLARVRPFALASPHDVQLQLTGTF